MRLLYRPAAIEDIERAADYIEHQLKNPSAAEKLKTTIVKKAALLKDNPEMGIADFDMAHKPRKTPKTALNLLSGNFSRLLPTNRTQGGIEGSVA